MFRMSDLVHILASTSDEKVIEDLLLGLTTENERSAILQRIEIIKRILKGDTHHRIADDLGVGVATVTRGSKELANGRFKIFKEAKEG
jgi:TrpR family trp operon transcriptional repressor